MSAGNMNAALTGSVHSLENSIHILENSVKILDTGVHDLPRIKKVLQSTRHFELTSESVLYTAQQALRDEICPEIERLLRRVEVHLAKMERREKTLVAKSELQEGRLQQKPKVVSSGGGGWNAQDAEKLKALRSRKERLAHTIGRLQLQASQEREAEADEHDLWAWEDIMNEG
ncbi:DASH complex subunit spc19 [Rhizina undulata]